MEDKSKKNGSIVNKAKCFMNDLWTVSSEDEKRSRRRAIVFARIIYTVFAGIVKKRILVQASSLSYATLLAVGPILAITVMFSSVFFKDKDEDFVYNNIMAAATFVMPAFNEISTDDVVKSVSTSAKVDAKVAEKPKTDKDTKKDDTVDAEVSNDSVKQAKSIDKTHINPEIYKFIDNISKGSAKAGIVGVIAMIITCLLLLINMESAFNYIWGVEVGRNWVNRIVFYFVMMFFGSVGTIFSAALFATPAIARMFGSIEFIRNYVNWISYGFGVLVMLIVLSSFYKFIPFTKVKWRSAIVGGVVVTLLMLLNHKGSFLYISYISKQQSLYGYLSIVAVAMFSLYIFWTVLLTGGMIAYAVQFVGFYDDDQAWNKIGGRTRRMCALAVFAEVSKEFYKRNSGCSNLDSLSHKLKLPKVVLAHCVKWLSEKDIVCIVDSRDDSMTLKPSIPPDSITVSEFLTLMSESSGDHTINERLSGYENSVKIVLGAISDLSKSDVFSKKIKDII